MQNSSYNDDFEKVNKDYYRNSVVIKNFYSNSSCYDLREKGLKNLPGGLRVGFINGVWNDFKHAQEGSGYVSRLAGGHNVHAVHNATHGGQDLPECIMGLNYIATDPVRQLHAMWNNFFENSSANAKFLMICHSQGAIHVRNALLDYPPELRARILVIAIAPAAYIYKETCGQVIHYRAKSWRDFIPRLDREGAKREKDTIVTLSSHPDAPLFDHEFMSPTYQESLQYHIKRFTQTQGETL